MRPALIVSIHDVAPATLGASAAWSRDLAARGVPATLLVVGGPWGSAEREEDQHDFAEWLRDRERAGDEIAVHGWTHCADLPGPLWRRLWGGLIARGAAEFWSLDEAEASLRAAAARDAVRASGIEPLGFTPPGWLASAASVAALRRLGFRYTTGHLGVLDLLEDRRHTIPVFCHRPGSRLQAAGATLVRRVVPGLVRRGRSVRLGLHPADLDHPHLRLAALEAIDRSLDLGGEPTTYLEYLSRERAAA